MGVGPRRGIRPQGEQAKRITLNSLTGSRAFHGATSRKGRFLPPCPGGLVGPVAQFLQQSVYLAQAGSSVASGGPKSPVIIVARYVAVPGCPRSSRISQSSSATGGGSRCELGDGEPCPNSRLAPFGASGRSLRQLGDRLPHNRQRSELVLWISNYGRQWSAPGRGRKRNFSSRGGGRDKLSLGSSGRRLTSYS